MIATNNRVEKLLETLSPMEIKKVKAKALWYWISPNVYLKQVKRIKRELIREYQI
jgi:ABC-type Zn uptake system ZnuABC Zn-binding protein ZnuA